MQKQTTKKAPWILIKICFRCILNWRYIRDNPLACMDMVRNISSSVRLSISQVRYKVEHKTRYSISTSNHVSGCLFYKHTDNDIFNNFLKICDHFLKRLQSLVTGTIPHIFWKSSEDFRRYLWRQHGRVVLGAAFVIRRSQF